VPFKHWCFRSVGPRAIALLVSGTAPALAEFEIQEATIEKGVELEYRGAEHWGLPDPGADQLRQSREFEMLEF
jgi:hypothetical protein